MAWHRPAARGRLGGARALSLAYPNLCFTRSPRPPSLSAALRRDLQVGRALPTRHPGPRRSVPGARGSGPASLGAAEESARTVHPTPFRARFRAPQRPLPTAAAAGRLCVRSGSCNAGARPRSGRTSLRPDRAAARAEATCAGTAAAAAGWWWLEGGGGGGVEIGSRQNFVLSPCVRRTGCCWVRVAGLGAGGWRRGESALLFSSRWAPRSVRSSVRPEQTGRAAAAAHRVGVLSSVSPLLGQTGAERPCSRRGAPGRSQSSPRSVRSSVRPEQTGRAAAAAHRVGVGRMQNPGLTVCVEAWRGAYELRAVSRRPEP